MIHGIGTDLVEIERLRRGLARHGERLPQRLLHPAEWPRYRADRDPARWLAKCFAAKEAVAKALGTGLRGIALRDIGLITGPLRRPDLAFSDHGGAALARAGVAGWHVSISDEAGLVVAFVVLVA